MKNLCFSALLSVCVLYCAHAAPKTAPKAAPKAVAKPAKSVVPAGYEPAKFVLPPYSYNGTPKVVENTNARLWRARAQVYLPKGAVNLALHKPVTSSDEAPTVGSLSLITDGQKESVDGRWVELGPNTQWVQIDLGQSSTINGVLMWHYFGDSRVYRDVIIQLADDPDFIEGVQTVFNNDNDSSSGKGVGRDLEYYEHFTGQWLPIAAKKARYVRLYSRGNTSDPVNHYIEVEVWGQAK